MYRADLGRVLMLAVHFRNRPELRADTNLVDLGHVLEVLEQEGHDAALALDRNGRRTLLFLQKGVPARIYFGDPAEDTEQGSLAERFLAFGFQPGAPRSQVDVFRQLMIEPDPDAGQTLLELDRRAKPPPPMNVQFFLSGRLVLQRQYMPPAMLIGRDPAAELRLDNLSISWRHAKLSWERGQFFLEDLGSSNGTIVNGRRIKRHPIEAFDAIHIGKYGLRMVAASATQPPHATVMLPSTGSGQLYLADGVRAVPITSDATIGKAEGVDIQVRGLGVQPIHARLKVEGSQSVAITCYGHAAVKINSRKVRAGLLMPDDELVVGRTRFRLVSVRGSHP